MARPITLVHLTGHSAQTQATRFHSPIDVGDCANFGRYVASGSLAPVNVRLLSVLSQQVEAPMDVKTSAGFSRSV